MRKGTFIATIALLIAIAGAIVAFAAYFKRRSCALCDDLDDELMDDMSDLDYYATQVDEDDEEDVCGCGCSAPEEPSRMPRRKRPRRMTARNPPRNKSTAAALRAAALFPRPRDPIAFVEQYGDGRGGRAGMTLLKLSLIY